MPPCVGRPAEGAGPHRVGPDIACRALAAPVALDRQAVYHIENYGSAMAPFYTTLSIWVAGIVLAAMLKANVMSAISKHSRRFTCTSSIWDATRSSRCSPLRRRRSCVPAT